MPDLLSCLYETDAGFLTIEDFVSALRSAGIAEGDTIFVHSDTSVFGKLAVHDRGTLCLGLIAALEQAVGETGTVIMPTFSYSFCRGEAYDAAHTPSTVGVLTEYFRKAPGVFRTAHPIFSVAVWGKRQDRYRQTGKDSFGDASVFDILRAENGKVVFLGASFHSATFIHHIEQAHQVPYRYFKEFRGTIRDGAHASEDVATYYVRDLEKDTENDFDRIQALLERKNVMRRHAIGHGTILSVRAQDFFSECSALLRTDPYGLLRRGRSMEELIRRLFPICRSIAGEGARQTLRIVQEHIPIEIREVPSGTKVFDWTVPKEWNIRDAYVKNAQGERVIDFQKSNLHVINYSTPVRTRMGLAELKEHIRTFPEHPDWIPYATTYYKEQWGFCLSHNDFLKLEDGEYEVVIDSTLEQGSLTYGELLLKGETDDEVLLTCYTCHPSMCNDNLSGVALLTFLAKELMHRPRRYSYRLLFIPETIGAITWLALNQDRIGHIKHGLVASCVGDAGPSITYKRTRHGGRTIDRVVETILKESGRPYDIVPFNPADGSDERQLCSPAFDLPVGSIMRTPYARFPEYHTSADTPEKMSAQTLEEMVAVYAQVCDALNRERFFTSTMQTCEPQLGRRGLYRQIGAPQGAVSVNESAIFWVLNFSDGRHSLGDIAARSGISCDDIVRAAEACRDVGLLVETI